LLKFGQLQTGVESRETTMHSAFFRLKHSFTIAEQKILHISAGDHPLKNFPSGDMVTMYADARRVRTIIFLSQKRIENLVFIILGRLPINKTQK
jgi:hypothetical protein